MHRLSIKYGHNNVPYLTKDDMEHDAERLLKDFDPDIFENPHPLDVEMFIEAYLGAKLVYTNLSHNNTYLGRTVFNDHTHIYTYDAETNCAKDSFYDSNTIIIESSLADQDNREHRFRYTCAHESGHFIYHKRFYEIDGNQMNLFDMVGDYINYSLDLHTFIDAPETQVFYNKRSDSDWLEWQANYMAAALLMPKASVYKLLRSTPTIGMNKDKRQFKCKLVSDTFNVSLTAAKIRLQTLKIL